MTTNEALIKVENLKKSFGKLDVLNGINEDINRGDVVVVIGPSGSGKSTFLRCLNLLEKPTGGAIYFDGENILAKSCDKNKLREKMGMVFQHFNLFPHLTILKNITIAPVKLGLMSQAEANEKAMALLKRIGLEEKSYSYP